MPQGILPARTSANSAATAISGSASRSAPDQIQPASLDLRLGEWAYRVRASFLPGPGTHGRRAARTAALHGFSLTRRGARNGLRLYRAAARNRWSCRRASRPPPTPRARPGGSTSSPASSPIEAREFDKVPEGYEGPLYAEISPRTFSILARTGSRLSQIRFRAGAPLACDEIIASCMRARR